MQNFHFSDVIPTSCNFWSLARGWSSFLTWQPLLWMEPSRETWWLLYSASCASHLSNYWQNNYWSLTDSKIINMDPTFHSVHYWRYWHRKNSKMSNMHLALSWSLTNYKIINMTPSLIDYGQMTKIKIKILFEQIANKKLQVGREICYSHLFWWCARYWNIEQMPAP